MYTSYTNCFSRILKKEGVKGFYKGYLIRLFTGIGGGFMLVAYDRLLVSIKE